MGFKQKTLFYKRASWSVSSKEQNLEELLREAHSKNKTADERTFVHTDGRIVGLSVKNSNGFFLHIAYYTPKQNASTVPNPAKKEDMDTGVQEPPPKYDFLNGDIFVLVKENHLIFCPSGVRENVAVLYFRYILRKWEQGDLSNHFEIVPVANISKVKLIKEEGVKKVSLNSYMYEAAYDQLERKTIKHTLIQKVAEEVMSLISKEKNPMANPENLENLMVKIEISFDSRKKGGDASKVRLEQLGRRIAANEDGDGDGIKIITGSGKTISADEIRISKFSQVNEKGSSVSRASAWEKLEEYYQELKKEGMLSN